MSIRAKLIAAASISLLITLAIGGAFLWVQQRVDQLQDHAEMAESLAEHLNRLDSFTREYIQTQAARPRQQAMQTFAALPALLRQLERSVAQPRDRERLQAIRERLRQEQWSFDEYARLAGQPLNPIQEAYRADVADRLIMDSRSLRPLIRLLHMEAHRVADEFEGRTLKLAYLLLVFGTGVVLALLIPIFLRINRGLSGLTQGIRDLRFGHLGSRIRITGQDEFNTLADGFNVMAETLAATLASRDELNAEILERKQAEASLRESEARFRQLLDVAPVPMCHVTQDGTVAYFNRRFADTFGYAKEDIPTLAQWWALAYPDPEYRQWVLTTWNAAVEKANMEGTDIQSVEYRVTRKDGVERIVVIAGITIGTDFLATFHDVTERHQLEQARLHYAEKLEREVALRTADLSRRTAELEAANQDLENFSYSVSHDLRAPLRAIDGFIAMLLDEHAGQLDAEGRRMFGVVSDNARKMGHLIDDILAFSRAGRLELDPVPVDMEALVREVWNGLVEAMPGQAIELKLEALPSAQCDPRALRQVWQNLLANAIKFSRERDLALIEVGAVDAGEFIRYHVKDNGVGFNPDYVHKLFVLFQRLHGMDEFEGTGVGLAIVKRFIQKHGGEVAADGGLDQGATFSFTLPKHLAND